jgi:hypothetical protein
MKAFFYRETIVALNFSLLVLALSIFFYLQQPFASESQPDEKRFSLDVNGEPLSMAMEKISEASGYKIVLNTEIGDLTVSIQLKNVTLHEAIRRIFKNYNHMEIWDYENKKLELYVWDDKGAPVSVSGKKTEFIPSTKTIQ